jgi:uncharacterized protein YidB (DUF937 family)
MGLLDGLVSGMGGGQARQPGLGGTIAAGAILALLVKGVRQYQASRDGSAAAGVAPAPGAAGGLGGLLGGAGGGIGGLLSSLGGAGALGALVNRFQQQGYGQQADSWVGSGANQSIAPHQVGEVLGEDGLNALLARTGLNRDQLLQELAQELPQAINAVTPEGRLPNDAELHQLAHPT